MWSTSASTIVAVVCIAAAALTGALALLLHFGGDRSTLGTLLLYAPRRFVPVAWLVLAVAAFFASKRWGAFALLGALLSALFLAGFNVPRAAIPLTGASAGADGRPFRVVTYNVDFDAGLRTRLASAVPRWNADVIVLQACGDEAFADLELAMGKRTFVAKIYEFCFASPHPIVATEHLGYPDQKGRPIAAWVRFLVGGDTVSVVSVHLASPRRELTAALQFDFSLIPRSVNTREAQSILLLRYLQQIGDPLVVAGDFNTLAEGFVYDEYFAPRFRNVFNERGWGPGYTMRNGVHRLRIDHVLVRPSASTSQWQVESDWPTEHVPVVADVRLR